MVCGVWSEGGEVKRSVYCALDETDIKGRLAWKLRTSIRMYALLNMVK